MTMKFRTIKDNIVEILSNNSKNCFQVVGHQRQSKSADETLENNRMVQVYSSFGDIPKSGGSVMGPVLHDVTYRIELTVSAPAKGDLSILDNPEASAIEVATALAEVQEASSVADELLDELYDLVFQILMDSRNYNMGMPDGDVTNRWVGKWQKDDPLEKGQYTILTGNMFLELRTDEQVVGIIAETTDNIQDVVIDIDGDDNEKTGKTVNQ